GSETLHPNRFAQCRQRHSAAFPDRLQCRTGAPGSACRWSRNMRHPARNRNPSSGRFAHGTGNSVIHWRYIMRMWEGLRPSPTTNIEFMLPQTNVFVLVLINTLIHWGNAREVEFLSEVAGGDVILGHLAQHRGFRFAAILSVRAAR